MSSSHGARVGSQRPRLSLVPPGRRSSAGVDAVEFAASCGLFLDDWQAWCLDQMLSESADGRWLAEIVALVVPRQNGKNAVLEALELYAFFVLNESRILHTAHLGKTAADHMRRMAGLVGGNPDLDEVTTVYWSNGKEAIERTDTGARIEFITRGRKTARGGSPSRIVFDEALFLTDEQIQAILFALSAQSLKADPPQMVYTSSAPLPESLVLHRLRQAALTGSASQMFFAEWSCEPGVDLDDPEALREALYLSNPGMGIRISYDWVLANELVVATREAFSVERLGVVEPMDAGHVRLVSADVWAAAGDDPLSLEVEVGRRVLAWDVSPNRSWASVGWVGRRADGTLHQEIVESQAGTDWVAGRLARYVSGAGELVAGVAYVGGSPAEALVPDVQASLPGVELFKVSGQSYVAACGDWFDKTVAGTLRHVRQPWLTDAVDAAVWRDIGESKVWDRRRATADITPLVVVTAALRGLQLAPEVAQPPMFAFT